MPGPACAGWGRQDSRAHHGADDRGPGSGVQELTARQGPRPDVFVAGVPVRNTIQVSWRRAIRNDLVIFHPSILSIKQILPPKDTVRSPPGQVPS